jgi:hypothetical protein
MNIEGGNSVKWVRESSRLLRFYESCYDDTAYKIDIYTQEITPVAGPFPHQVPGGAVGYNMPDKGMITVYAEDGNELYQLDLRDWSTSPSTISPDLKWFVFTSYGRDKEPPRNIYKAGKEQLQPQLVLRGLEFTYEGEYGRERKSTNLALKGVWSPDGQWFLVLNQFNGKGGQELYAVNVETDEVRTVMEFEAPDLYVEGIDAVVWLK